VWGIGGERDLGLPDYMGKIIHKVVVCLEGRLIKPEGNNPIRNGCSRH